MTTILIGGSRYRLPVSTELVQQSVAPARWLQAGRRAARQAPRSATGRAHAR